jgi:outer membrane protein OmpA-like peptidoglycan-associated protein
MMTPQLVRVSCGLLAALLVAALLKFSLFDITTLHTTAGASVFSLLGSSLGYVLVYGLPLAGLAVAATEFVRLRSIGVYIALGIVLALLAARFSIHGETLTSPAFSGGALTAIAVLITGVLSSLAYWIISGRRAGWRGDAAERADTLAREAFRTASADAHVEHCKECLAIRAGLGVLLFMLFGWVSIETGGLRAWLVAETEVQGKAVLKNAGYAWATFEVDGNRGVIHGLAPDEAEKRAAYDSVREALGSVVGFPGILARIKNEAVASMPMSDVSRKLADAALRENEAKVAIEAAKIAAESARAAEAAAGRKADEHVSATEAELKRKAEEQVLAAEAEFKRKGEEQARAAEAALQRKLDEQARLADEQARKKAAAVPAPPPTQPVEVAAVETGTQEEARANIEVTPPASVETAPQGNSDVSTNPPAVDPAAREGAAVCTSQDLALLESSTIMFDRQKFEIGPGFDGELDRLAASAVACAPRPILVTGHADSVGDRLFNPALGLQRAQSIREKLISRGVPSTRVIATFAGTSGPAFNDTNSAERAFNRRAEFKFLEAAEISRDATLEPDERATTCESDLSGIMSQSTIYFPTASARVSAESMGLIKKLAAAIETCGSVVVTVEGHTDKIGDANYNQGLSEARANTVREELVAAGANPTRVASRGFSSNRPHDPADTAQAFALNRRIEFKVSGKFTTTSTGGP